MLKDFYVYIMASKRNGTLYIGVTSDLIKRVWQHKSGVIQGFTSKYSVHSLVYFEQHVDAESAIRREKRLKSWKRQWKIDLISKTNPHWLDRYPALVDPSVKPKWSGIPDDVLSLLDS